VHHASGVKSSACIVHHASGSGHRCVCASSGATSTFRLCVARLLVVRAPERAIIILPVCKHQPCLPSHYTSQLHFMHNLQPSQCTSGEGCPCSPACFLLACVLVLAALLACPCLFACSSFCVSMSATIAFGGCLLVHVCTVLGKGVCVCFVVQLVLFAGVDGVASAVCWAWGLLSAGGHQCILSSAAASCFVGAVLHRPSCKLHGLSSVVLFGGMGSPASCTSMFCLVLHK
jgi:hypothetical protein